jgi:rRNA maturation RNase YbeY
MSFKIINQKFINHQLNESKILKIADTIFRNEKILFEKINIILEDDEYLRSLKNQYFSQNFYTDVIAFNLADSGHPIDGEIYISLPRIIDNANEYNSNLNDEFKRIIIHGLLHLVGYDDQTSSDKKHMTDLENQYININSGIIITYE